MTSEQALLLLDIQRGLRLGFHGGGLAEDLWVLESAGLIERSVGLFDWATTDEGDAEISRICGRDGEVHYMMALRSTERAPEGEWRFVKAAGEITTTMQIESATPFGEPDQRLKRRLLTHPEIKAVMILKITR